MITDWIGRNDVLLLINGNNYNFSQKLKFHLRKIIKISRLKIWRIACKMAVKFFKISKQSLYARSGWLLSGHYFLVMTGHYEIFSRLDGSFELWVKLRARGRKQQKKWTKYNYIFNNWEKKLAYRSFFRMSDEESPRARKRMWKVASGVFIVFFFKNSAKRAYNK